MAQLGQTWGNVEISALLPKWFEVGIQHQILRAVRNVHLFREIAEDLRHQGYDLDFKQCRKKIKALKKQCRETVNNLRWKTLMSNSSGLLKFTA